MMYRSANFDEDVFDDPYTFNILRDPNPHVGFGGTGAHYCIGTNLARMTIDLMFNAIADAMPDLTSLAKPERLRSGWLNGIKHWQVDYTGESAKSARRSRFHRRRVVDDRPPVVLRDLAAGSQHHGQPGRHRDAEQAQPQSGEGDHDPQRRGQFRPRRHDGEHRREEEAQSDVPGRARAVGLQHEPQPPRDVRWRLLASDGTRIVASSAGWCPGHRPAFRRRG